jgi:amino acid permease
MARKIAYWTSTVIACLAPFGSLTYLSGNAEVVAGFAKAGYPQHLRIVLGIAKPIAAIVLLLPGFALLKE